MNARHIRPVLALLAMLAALCACGGDIPKDKLSGAIGPGSGGPLPTLGSLTASPIDKPDGTLIGGFSYDSGFFLYCTPPFPAGPCNALPAPDPTEIGVLVDINPPAVPPQIEIAMTHISGRPDTPCRFDAAVLARDSGYGIGDTGFRSNDLDQRLYQVNLSSPGAYAELFCANLSQDTGAQFSILADSADKVSWLEVYAVLNSVHGG